MLPGGWVTLRDVYYCAIDKALFAQTIQQAQTYAADLSDAWISVSAKDWTAHLADLNAFGFHLHPAVDGRVRAPLHSEAIGHLTDRNIEHQIERTESTATMEIRLRVEAVNRWYVHDWNTLDNKIPSSIVEGNRGRPTTSVRVPVDVRLAGRRAGILPAGARGAAAARHGRTAAGRQRGPRVARARRYRLERRSPDPRCTHRGRQA